jgi:hypothetical protein
VKLHWDCNYNLLLSQARLLRQENIVDDTGNTTRRESYRIWIAYCPPRVACVDSLSSLDSSDNDSSNGDDQIAEEEILLIDQSNIGKEEESET